LETIALRSTPATFTLERARDMLPLIQRITRESQELVDILKNRWNALRGTNTLLALQVEREIDREIKKWQEKIQRLGAMPMGLWTVDFDHGDGFYCWQYPESDIKFCHGYQDGFSGRTSIK
jgi:hypothetical protein